MDDNLQAKTEKLLKCAAQKLPIPAKATPAEELLYFRAAELFDMFNRKMITKECATQRKHAIIADFKAQNAATAHTKQLNAQTAELFKGIELACAAYCKNRTLENADNLVYAIHHIMPKRIAD